VTDLPSWPRQWAALIARIYEVFPLVCPVCAGQMRIIAFFTEGQQASVDAMPDWDMTNQSAPDYPEDQRTDW